jgi:DNA repair exonuclease SbcCD nuclease subunit
LFSYEWAMSEPAIADWIDGAEALITAIPQPTKQFIKSREGVAESDKSVAQAMGAIFAGFGAIASNLPIPHVLLGHWQVQGAKISERQTLTGYDIEIPVDAMMLAQPDLICLGHIHMAQKVGDRGYYAGSMSALTWGELDKKGFYLHTLEDKTLVSSEFVPTPSPRRILIDTDATVEPVATVPDIVEQHGDNVQGAKVRWRHKTFADEAGLFPADDMKKMLVETFGALDVEFQIARIPRANVRAKTLLEVEALPDKLVEREILNGGQVPQGALEKARMLQTMSAKDLLAEVRGDHHEQGADIPAERGASGKAA